MKSVGIVTPVFNEVPVLPHYLAAMQLLMQRLGDRYRVSLLLVDDGSTDGTWELIRDAALRDSRVSGLRLSRNFGHQAALTCGYQLVAADAVVTMDADLQDPPETVEHLLDEWERGARVVLAVRRSRSADSASKRLSAALFYRVMRLIGESDAVPQTGDFRLLDRQVVDVLNTLPEHHRYIRGLVGWLGFEPVVVTFDRPARRAGATKYPIRRMLRFAVDGMVSLSFVPLRLAYLLAFASAIPFLVYLAYNLVLYAWYGVEMVPGWSSLILAITAFGVANLLVLGILGEYAGRIYEEVKRRPLYVVAETCGRRSGQVAGMSHGG